MQPRSISVCEPVHVHAIRTVSLPSWKLLSYSTKEHIVTSFSGRCLIYCKQHIVQFYLERRVPWTRPKYIRTCCRRILCIKKTVLGTIQKQKEHGAIFTCHPTTFTCHTAHFYPAHNIPCSAFPEGCPIVSMGCTLLCVAVALGGGKQCSCLLPLPYAPAHTPREHKLEVVKTISKLYTYKDNIYTVLQIL